MNILNKCKNAFEFLAYSPAPITKKLLPDWMEQTIYEDIHAVSNLPTVAPENFSNLLICRIKKSRFYFKHCFNQSLHRRLLILKKALKTLERSFVLPDVEFAIHYDDSTYNIPTNLSMPILTFAKRSDCYGPIRIPDFEMLSGYNALTAQVYEFSNKYPWEKKINMAFWRGSTTGGYFDLNSYQSMPRFQLCIESLKYPSKIDAKFTGFVQCSQEIINLLQKQNLTTSSATIEQHFPYKYLIDIDGNSCTYSRMYWSLLSNCLLLKYQSSETQWYYKGLQHMKNVCFFSLENNSLLNTLEMLQKNDALAQSIAMEGSDFCKKYLDISTSLHYLYKVIEQVREK